MIVDTAVHPQLGESKFKALVGEPWSLARWPNYFGNRYFPPTANESTQVAEDPVALADLLFRHHGIDAAILTPLTRGYFPNPQMAAAIAHATNRWLHDDWLFAGSGGRSRLFGSIRVGVNNPTIAVAEIDRWANDSAFVQVAVPLRVLAPYGDERYFPIWKKASDSNLPIYVLDDFACQIEPVPTQVGYPRYFAEHQALTPFAAVNHIANLISSGVFDRLPNLRFVFADGGVDLCRVMMWRLDKDWRSDRVETPWVTKPPSEYLSDHVRFVSNAEDGTTDGRVSEGEVIRVSRGHQLVLFGSHYPHWNTTYADAVLSGWPDTDRQRVMALNAIDFYPRLAAYVARQPSVGHETVKAKGSMEQT